MERFLSGITRSGSICKWKPSPLHSGHIPWGALNENIFGVISGKEIWPSGQASLDERIKSSPSITFISTSPSVSSRAVSKESASLEFIPSFITILSTIIDISCFFVFESSISSSRSYLSPSIITLT